MNRQGMNWILLDFDGTVVDTSGDIAAATNHVRARMGLPPLPVEEVLRHVGGGADKLLEEVLPLEPRPELDEMVALWRAYYVAHPADHSLLYPGMEKVLQALPPSRMALVSNKPEEVVRQVARALSLEERFAVLLGWVPGRPRKPDPTILREALETLGGEPGDAVMVGDGAPDMEAARALGCPGLGAGWGFHGRETLEKAGATRILERPEEILELWEETKTERAGR